MDEAGGDLHDEQTCTTAPQGDCVEVEEVGGQQPGRRDWQERPPRRVTLAWGWADPCGGEDAADGASTDRVAQPDQLPWIRRWPEPGLSRARRNTRSRRSRLISGRPGRFG